MSSSAVATLLHRSTNAPMVLDGLMNYINQKLIQSGADCKVVLVDRAQLKNTLLSLKGSLNANSIFETDEEARFLKTGKAGMLSNFMVHSALQAWRQLLSPRERSKFTVIPLYWWTSDNLRTVIKQCARAFATYDDVSAQPWEVIVACPLLQEDRAHFVLSLLAFSDAAAVKADEPSHFCNSLELVTQDTIPSKSSLQTMSSNISNLISAIMRQGLDVMLSSYDSPERGIRALHAW